jgi:hypothetical protein
MHAYQPRREKINHIKDTRNKAGCNYLRHYKLYCRIKFPIHHLSDYVSYLNYRMAPDFLRHQQAKNVIESFTVHSVICILKFNLENLLHIPTSAHCKKN